MQDGLQHLLRATELDPSLIGARVDLVNLCITQCFYGFMSPSMEADIANRTVDAVPDLPARSEVGAARAWLDQFPLRPQSAGGIAAHGRCRRIFRMTPGSRAFDPCWP